MEEDSPQLSSAHSAEVIDSAKDSAAPQEVAVTPVKATAATSQTSTPQSDPLPSPAHAMLSVDPAPTRTPLRQNNRRISSPLNIDASMLDASFAPDTIGDKTYDELEVAVETNTRRRSIGIALLAPLPPSPDSSDGWGSPEPIRCASCSSPVATAEGTPKDFKAKVSTGRSVRELARRFDMPPPASPVNKTSGNRLMLPPLLPMGSAQLRGPSPLRNSPLTSRTDAAELDQSTMLPAFDLSRRFAGLDQSRLSLDGPALLDAASFRLTPPKARPSSIEFFDQDAAPAFRTPVRPPRTPAARADQTIDIQQLLQRTARPKRPSGTEESFLAGVEPIAEINELTDLSDDDEVLVPVSLRPKERLTAPPAAPSHYSRHDGQQAEADDMNISSASLAQLGGNGLPLAPHAPGGIVRSSSTRALGSGIARSNSTRALGLPRSDSTRVLGGITRSETTQALSGLQRSDSTRSIGRLQRSDSARSVGIARSDSTRSIGKRETIHGSGMTRSDSTRAIGNHSRPQPSPIRERDSLPAARQRMAAPPSATRAPRTLPPSTRATVSARLPPSSSSRNVGVPATPARPRDRPDVPLTMRRRPQLAEQNLRPSGEDRWADAVERDPVAARRPPATAPVDRRLPPSTSSRRSGMPSSGSASMLNGISEGRVAATGIRRGESVRSTISQPPRDRVERNKVSAPPSLSSLPRSGSGDCVTGPASTVSSTASSLSRGTASSMSRATVSSRGSATPRASTLPSRRTSVVPETRPSTAAAAAATTTAARHSIISARSSAPPTTTTTRSSAPARHSIAPRQSLAPRATVAQRQSLAPRVSAASGPPVVRPMLARPSITSRPSAAAEAPSRFSSASRRNVAPPASHASHAAARRAQPLSDADPIVNAPKRATPSAGAAYSRAKLTSDPQPPIAAARHGLTTTRQRQ